MGWSEGYGGDREPGAWGGAIYGAVHQYIRLSVLTTDSRCIYVRKCCIMEQVKASPAQPVFVL